MSSSRDESIRDIHNSIGAKVRGAREAAGLTQRELAKKLGVSYNKVHKLELGRTRMLISDLIEIAAALDTSPWILLRGIITPPDFRLYLTTNYRDLADESEAIIDQWVGVNKWFERYFRGKLRMPYRPIYYFHPKREPIEFDEEWENPTLKGGKRLLYLQKKGDELVGYFFEAEIVPCPSLDATDTPMFSDKAKWEDNEEQFRQFLEENGYCWQLYPIKMHHQAYCSPEHRTEIESQREAAKATKGFE